MPKATKPRTTTTTPATTRARARPLSTRNANSKQPSSTQVSQADQADSKDSKKPVKKEEKAKDGVKKVTKSKTKKEAVQADVAPDNANKNSTSGTLPAAESNYLVQVRLDVDEPAVTRLLSLPPSLNFAEIHEILQIAFNWTNSHAHSFHVSRSDFQGMTLNGIPCTRDTLRIESNDMDLDITDDDEDDNVRMENEITLGAVYEDPHWEGKAVITYEYDHGDSWTHIFALLGHASPDIQAQMHAPEGLKIFCLGGEGHHVAEDSGGVMGWEEVKEAFRKGKKADPEERRSWYDRICLNGGDGKKFDKYWWDIFDVNERLALRFAPELLKASG